MVAFISQRTGTTEATTADKSVEPMATAAKSIPPLPQSRPANDETKKKSQKGNPR
jgi:hypothetical protein